MYDYCNNNDLGRFILFICVGDFMTDKTIKEIEEKTRKAYENAKKHIRLDESIRHFQQSAISDVIPNYKSEDLSFGSYLEDNFAVVFIDMRNSTPRAQNLGPQKTFLSMHAFIPAMLYVIEHYKGHVIDLMGDGIMIFFYGKDQGFTNEIAIKHAGLCGRDMLRVLDIVVNPILKDDGIELPINCGVGVTYGNVVITKIGIEKVFDVKAFGDCINQASKYSKNTNQVKVSKKVKDHWPKGKNGCISFVVSDDGYIMQSK